MSSGVFTSGFYEANNGDILKIRHQPESVIATINPAQAGPATVRGSARVSSSPRSLGTTARCIYAVWETPPANYKAGGTIKIPVFTQAAFEAIQDGATITYLGGTARVTGRRPEYRR